MVFGDKNVADVEMSFISSLNLNFHYSLTHLDLHITFNSHGYAVKDACHLCLRTMLLTSRAG